MADIFIHASTSRSNVLSPDTLQIPVSDARSEPWSAKACADATRKRRRATSTSISSPTSSLSSDKEPLITRIRISKGIYQEGKHIVVTPQHPAVSECLAHCRKTWSFPPAIPDTILVLCALEVFFHPSDPAHWLFWSNKKKESSVELVNRICCTSLALSLFLADSSSFNVAESPPLIEPTRLWDESMLFSLSLLHGQAWHDALRHEPWYHTLVGCNKEDASVPNRPNLRKRKPAPEQETSRAQSMSPSEDSVDAAGPSTKRIRMSTSRSSTLPSSTRNSTRVIRKPAKFRDPDFEGSDVASTRSTTRSPSTSPTSLPSEASSAVTRRTASILSARTVIGSASDRSLSPLSDLTTSTLVEPEEPTQPRKRKARVVDIESTAGRKDKEKDNPEENTIMTRARARSTRR
ncbi:hypothetical protein VNI00_004039 [Paramarasmius palmivorus]|uniref:Uncharacterized protein n=1 Tax=Paramarasmius palmivorus TaxID=297713 RepID=A0AAW0DNV6_9AGAR